MSSEIARIVEPAASAILPGGGRKGAAVAERIREMIIQDELPPGAPIRERALAERLQVSRTPLREAIKILSTEGLVEVQPHRGAVVANPSNEELRGLVEYFSRMGVQLIAMTGRRSSTLARQASYVIDCGVDEEACPHDLAPTSSTTAAMAMGDALAVALLRRRGFTPDDFARLHPAGALGRRLLLKVRDVMLTEDLPILPPEATMRRAVVLLAEKRGTIAVTDEGGELIGVLTSGDLTRLMEKREAFFDVPVSEVMNPQPKWTRPDELGAAAVGLMERHGIMAMPVLDDNRRVVGMVHLHDLMRAGAI